MPHDGQTQGPRGWPNILGLLRGTNLRVTGKPGATAGAGLAGGTTSGAPPSGDYDLGDAVIGQDGTLRICTASGSPGTWVQLGTLVDPTSVRGDLIVRGASSTTRLALGATNQVLTSNGTDAVWAVSPASAGGALTQLSAQTLGSDSASVSFTSIAGTYSALVLQYYRARDDNAGSSLSVLSLRFNNDTAANYDYVVCTLGAGAVSGSETFGATSARIGLVVQGGATAGFHNTGQILIPGYADTTQHKSAWGQVSSKTGTSANSLRNEQSSVFWRSASAITRVDLLSASGNLRAGSTWVLYGVS